MCKMVMELHLMDLIHGILIINLPAVDNSLSKKPESISKNFLVSDEERTDNISDKVDKPAQNFSINFARSRTKFCLI